PPPAGRPGGGGPGTPRPCSPRRSTRAARSLEASAPLACRFARSSSWVPGGGPPRATGNGRTGRTVLSGWGGALDRGAERAREDPTTERPPAVGLGLAALHAHEFGAGRLATLRKELEAQLDAHLDRDGQEQPDPLGRNGPDLRGPVSEAADAGRAAEGG